MVFTCSKKGITDSARNGTRYPRNGDIMESDTIIIGSLLYNSILNPSRSPSACVRAYCCICKSEPLRWVVDMEGRKDQSSGRKMNVVVGPWGGNGGTNWDDGSSYNGVREIKLVYDHCIDSIRVVYDKNGGPVAAEKHGGVGGSKIAEIKLQFPEEFLTSVSGHYSPVVYGGSPVIRSITFKSNRRTFGPYGVEEGTPFSFLMEGGLIVGFKGRSGWYLDAIGFQLTRPQTRNLFQKVHRKLKKLASTASLA